MMNLTDFFPKRDQIDENELADVSLRKTQVEDRLMDAVSRLLPVPMILFFCIPVVLLFFRISPAHILETINTDMAKEAVAISLKTTLISLVLTMTFGTPVAHLMAKKRLRFKNFLEVLVDLPTVLPPSVAGLALLLALGRRGLIGGWLNDLGISLSFSQAAVVLAQMFVSAPFYIRSATIGFNAVDKELIQAAQLDGANRWDIFRYITVPLAQFAILNGAVMSWSRALGEFGATIIFAGNFQGRTQTMPMAIYIGFESNLDVALTLSVILIGFSFLSLLIMRLIIARKTG